MKTSTFPGTFSILEDDILPSWYWLKLGLLTNAISGIAGTEVEYEWVKSPESVSPTQLL